MKGKQIIFMSQEEDYRKFKIYCIMNNIKMNKFFNWCMRELLKNDKFYKNEENSRE